MKLSVSTPLAIIIETEDVAYVRAEDDSGCFGILPGHADLLTVLTVSVVTWRNRSGGEHYAAVRGGVLEAREGKTIEIGTSEAVRGDDLHRLETDVLTRFRRQLTEEQAARTDAHRLYLAALRQIVRFLRPQRPASLAGAPNGSVPSTRS